MPFLLRSSTINQLSQANITCKYTVHRLVLPITSFHRAFTTTFRDLAKDPKMNSAPPSHEMAYFPNMTTSLPSTSDVFRRVLWTGLYS